MSSSTTARLYGEIETPRPLRAWAGKISITGWCLNEIYPEAPDVRLVTDVETFHSTKRLERSDIPLLFPKHTAAPTSGFLIEGTLPSGVYLACFEAKNLNGSWQIFKILSLVVESKPFTAVIDEPITEGVLRDRVRVGGWALKGDETLAELSVRYGHRELPCKLGLAREDVAVRLPEIAAAGSAGFETIDYLVAGHGRARVRARFSSGRVSVVSTNVTFSIPTDENHSGELDLAARPVRLPDRKHFSATSAVPALHPLNILFVLHGSFASNSALHVAALANELALIGHSCVVAVPHDQETIAHHNKPGFQGVSFSDAEHGVTFNNGRGPDLIHAWTTRENVRQLTQKLAQRHNSKVVVHLEDNEQQVLALSLNRSFEDLENLPNTELDRLVPDALSHPQRSREFLATCDGITVITDTLKEFVPVGRPHIILRASADSRYFFPQPVPREFRRVLDLTSDTTVLFYHGNVHASNAAEVRELYTAVLQLNREGTPVNLIRTGLDRVDFLGPLAKEVAPFVLELGQILHHRHLPTLMSLADIFVQPGQPDAFNDYRFPSKLPEFFAIGRPVVLPRTNLGLTVRHEIDAYVLDRADAKGIAEAVQKLRSDRKLYDRLAQGAVSFSKEYFSWRKTAGALANFYAVLTV